MINWVAIEARQVKLRTLKVGDTFRFHNPPTQHHNHNAIFMVVYCPDDYIKWQKREAKVVTVNIVQGKVAIFDEDRFVTPVKVNAEVELL